MISHFAWAQDYVPGEVIVKFKRGASVSSFNRSRANSLGLQHRGGWAGLNLHQYKVGAVGVRAAIEDIQNDPDVEYVEPNYILRKGQVLTPTGFYSQSDLSSQSVSTLAGVFSQTSAAINVEAAWTAGAGTAEPIVAIIDSGMDMDHTALADALWVNAGEVAGNGIDDDNNGYIDDVNGWDFVQGDNSPEDGDGHGTHVAGIVRGTTQNLFASPVEAPKLKLMILRFLDNTGVGTTSNAIQAIYYAVNNGAQILNNSWGGSSYSRALHDAINYSYQQHTLFVAAAGNSSVNIDSSPLYPASYDVPNVLAVAATSDADTLAYFSNYGPNTVQIASPGVLILSSYKNNGYSYLSGTSMAAPFVAGMAALMLREKPGMWGYQLKNLIVASADSKAALSNKVGSGSRVNALQAVSNTQITSLSLSQPTYSVATSNSARSVASSSGGGGGGGGGCGRVTKLYNKFDGGKNSGGFDFSFLLIGLLPVLYMLYRRQKLGYKRKYERYSIQSTMKMKLGDQEVEGQVNTISLGGAGMNVQALLEEGSVMTMILSSPDGKDSISVQGKVVWKADAKKYGVSFEGIDELTQTKISAWVKS